MTSADAPIRVTVQQASLAKYRVPVFRELGSRPGIELEVLYGARSGIPNVDADGFGATLVPFRERRLGRVPMYWHRAQLQAVSRRRSDVAILSSDIHCLSLLPALAKSKLSGVRTILWGHGYSKRDRGWRRKVRNAVGRLSTALLFYNHQVAKRFADQGWDADRLFVAINSLDQQSIQDAKETWRTTPQRLAQFQRDEHLDDTSLLLNVSRLDPLNRVDLLIEAVANLRQRGLAAQAALIGTGEPEMSRLRKLAAERGVTEHIRFLGAIYDEQQLAPWFLSAALFVYPANIGLSLLHAMGYGLPVVTSDNQSAQNPEIEALEHDHNGLLYAEDCAASLTDTIARAIEDRDWLTRARMAAEATVRDRFNVQTMVDGMEAAIRYCTGSHR